MFSSDILSQFHEGIEGVSHGMGTVDQLPDYQYNVAEPNTETEDLPKQVRKSIYHKISIIMIIREQSSMRN